MGKHILVVEDDDTVLAFMLAVLKSEGHDVMSAASVDEARALLAEQPAGQDLCLIVDVVLHHESGIAFAQELLRNHTEFRVLLISGFTDDVLMMEPENAHRIAFLAKPFTKQELAAALDKLCG
jgi:DNA-binding NtrC family response regulator